MSQNAGLQGADPALAQILNRMQDRDEQQDNTCKKLLDVSKDMHSMAHLKTLLKIIG